MIKVVFVIGGQCGIGLGIFKVLVVVGYKVVIVVQVGFDDIDVVVVFVVFGINVVYYCYDFQDIDGYLGVFDWIEQDLGLIMMLVFNVGVFVKICGDMLDFQVDSFDFVMGINLCGVFFLVQDVVRCMILWLIVVDYQLMIFVILVSVVMVFIEWVEYCLFKVGVVMMVQLFFVCLVVYGIGVFDIWLGIIEMFMIVGVKDKYIDWIEGGLVFVVCWG